MPPFRMHLWIMALASVFAGCGADQQTLATPTRYLDPFIVGEELALVANADFEETEDGRPSHWIPRDNPQLVNVSEDVFFSGSRALRIMPGGDVCLVEQSIPVEAGEFGGRVMTASAHVNAGEGNWAALNLTLEDFETFYSTPHPLDGEWHRLTVSTVVPKYWAGSRITLALYGRAPQVPYYFDDVRLTVK